jgi:MFS family permease
LAVLLALEGLAYGAYLVAGQTWVADHTTAAGRGAAVGLYASLGSLGGIIAPLAFGLLGERYGVDAVFIVNGWVMLVGLVLATAATILVARSEVTMQQRR